MLDLINSASVGVTASINAAGDGIQLADTASGTGTLTVDAVGKKTALDLRIAAEAETIDIGGTPTQVIDGATAVTIDIDADNTLEDLVEKINDAGLPLSASIFSDGSPTNPFRLSLTSTVSGAAGRLVFDTSAAGFALDAIVAAQDARLLFGSITAGGIVATSSTGKFDDLVSGVSLTVKQASDDPVTISIAETDASFISAVKTLVDQYNKLHAKIQTQTLFNPDNNTTGILFGSNETLRIESQLSRLFTGRQAGLSGVESLAELGVSVNDDGSLALDEAKLKAQYAADSEGVQEFLARVARLRGQARRADRVVRERRQLAAAEPRCRPVAQGGSQPGADRADDRVARPPARSPAGAVLQHGRGDREAASIAHLDPKHPTDPTAMTIDHTYLESEVLTASPQRLRLMLIDGAIRFARQTLVHWEVDHADAASQTLMRCRAIVTELLASVRGDRASCEHLVNHLRRARPISPAQRDRDVDGLYEAARNTAGIYVFLFRDLTAAQMTRRCQSARGDPRARGRARNNAAVVRTANRLAAARRPAARCAREITARDAVQPVPAPILGAHHFGGPSTYGDVARTSTSFSFDA